MQKKLHSMVQECFDFKIGFEACFWDFERYTKNILHLDVCDYSDPLLQEVLLRDKEAYYLYTSGGIVPESIFSMGIKMLHVHPGIVPHVRGSDGVFWSLLQRGKLGYSCFFMNAGIDTGDLIYQEEFEVIRCYEMKDLVGSSLGYVYAALLAYYDPHYRGMVLAKAISNINGELFNMKGVPQKENEGECFYAMHPRLLYKVIRDFFCNKNKIYE